MPDLSEFSIARSGNANLNVPTWTIKGRIVDRGGGLPDIDFTNGVSFPQVLGQLTAAQQDDLVQFLVLKLLQLRFGI